MKRILYWAPRVLALLAALFVGLFALDVFSEGHPLGEAIVGFIIHLTPTWLILAALIIAWRWERLGGAAFLALAAGFLFWFGLNWNVVLILALPAAVIGLLFLADWRYRSQRTA
jgi:hypothetical protein